MRSILAVDDSPSMRKMVAFTLAGAGFRVVEAVDGVDALEKAQLEQVDLVLADQNMPRLVKPFDPNRLIEVIQKVMR